MVCFRNRASPITTAGWNMHTQLGETFSAALKHPKLESDRDGHLLILRELDGVQQ